MVRPCVLTHVMNLEIEPRTMVLAAQGVLPPSQLPQFTIDDGKVQAGLKKKKIKE